MSWCPDRRVERIAKYALQFASDSLADQFRHAALHAQEQAAADSHRSVRVSQIEDLGVRLIREGTERISEDLKRVLTDQYGSVPVCARAWLLQMTQETVTQLRVAIRDDLDARFDSSERGRDRMSREENKAMRACAIGLISVPRTTG